MANETLGALRRIHPLVAVAAVAVTALSVTGIAAMTGHLGSSRADAPMQVTAPAAAPVITPAAAPVIAAVPVPVKAAAPADAPAAAPSHAAPKVHRPAAPVPASAQTQAAPVRAAIDPSMGTVLAINRVELAGQSSGVGAVVGGVVGGVAGHQVGGGRGKDAMTVLGAVGGAIAGNAIEKHERKTYRYDVDVRSEDGSMHTLHYTKPPAFNVGERISLKSAG